MIESKLVWRNAKESVPDTSNNTPIKDSRELSNLCLVRVNTSYGDKLKTATYIKPAKEGDVDYKFWADEQGNELEDDVLFWTDLKETEEFITGFCVELS